MSYALRLAEKGRGTTSPNPVVGAVLVKDGKIISEGWHEFPGGPHAEIIALEKAGKNSKGATLYVTLEPCSSYGRTPPCSDAIIKAGISRVVYGIDDPNPKHSGRAEKILKNAGIQVHHPLMEEDCFHANEAFFKWIKTGYPFLTLKLAISLDAKIANSNGFSRWITSEKTRRRVQKLRLASDAILIGSETLRKDKPSLTIRDFKVKRQPLRLVASANLDLDEAKKLFSSASGGEIRIIKARTRDEWIFELKKLGKENITSILVEGGAKLSKTLIEFNLIDKIELHCAPILIGHGAIEAFQIEEHPVNAPIRFKIAKIAKSGDDFILHLYPNKISPN